MSYPWHHTLQNKLAAAKQAGRLPHALLFSATEGCGHETFLTEFAQSLLCLQPTDSGTACGQCRSCEVFQAAAHPDFSHVKTPADKQVISVDQIRALNQFLELSRSYSPVRIAIISDADAMNVNAANSLLKTLEEPAANTHIILFSFRVNQLLPTIRSRCQQFRMALPAQAAALSWLETQQLTQPVATLLERAGGRPLQAVLLDNGELIAKQQAWLQQLFDVLQHKAALASVAADWSKHDKGELLDWQMGLLHNMLRQQFTRIPVDSAQSGNRDSLLQLEKLLESNSLWKINDELLRLKALATHPLNPQLFAEHMLSSWLK